MRGEPIHRGIVLVDVEGSNRPEWTDVIFKRIRARLRRLLDAALARAGIRPSQTVRTDTGDGCQLVVRSDVSTVRLLHPFASSLTAGLAADNRKASPAERMRLRVVVHHGPVLTDAAGPNGTSIAHAARLLDADAVRGTLARATEATAILVVSDEVYNGIVRHGYAGVDPGGWQPVGVRAKETATRAWVHLPGLATQPDLHALHATPPAGPDVAPIPRTLPGPMHPAQSGPPARVTPGCPQGSGRLVGLPRDSVYFTGRSRELAQLVGFLSDQRAGGAGGAVVHGDGGEAGRRGGSVSICVVRGMPGIGKTALAVHAAHRAEAAFPDGCLFLDLHGYSEGAVPVSAADALDRCLRQLGVPAEMIPRHTDDRASLYRDRLRARRQLIVLDNVRSVGGILPLLPAGPACRVLITSRERLTALDEARHISLDPLPPDDAVALFRSVAGDRLAQEPDTAVLDRIAAWCGRLPLAIRIAAARYRDGTVMSLEQLERGLADRHQRLEELDDGHRTATAVFATSQAALPAGEQRLFGLLALHPGHDLDAYAAAALAGSTLAATTRGLARLRDAHLLTEHAVGRYGFHDLVHVFAAGSVRERMPEEARDLARIRLLDYSNRMADLADGVITPHRYRMPLDLEHPPAAVPALRDHDEALGWFTAEAANLVAACRMASDRGRLATCWQLAYSLRGLFFLTRRLDDWVRTHRLALAATQELGDRHAEACTRNNLGLALVEHEDPTGAMEQYQAALVLFRQLGDDHGVSNTLGHCAWVHYRQGELRTSLREYQQALAFYERTGVDRYTAITLRGMALTEIGLRKLTPALQHLDRALRIFTDLDLAHDAAMALNSLGEAYLAAGDRAAATACHERAITLGQSCGSRFEQARAHEAVGAMAASTGDRRQARQHLELALTGYEQLDSTATSRVRQRLDELAQG